jgi:pyruvate formate lyase activating enzyme
VKPALPEIRGLTPCSLDAWEGKISAVLYLPGCNLDCPGCPVPYLKPTHSAGENISFDTVLDAIYVRRRWIDGIVVRGGEPLLHLGLFELLRTLGEFGLKVKLVTNGTRPDRLVRVMDQGLVEFVSLHLKAPLNEKYEAACGGPVDLAAVYESIETLLRGEVPYEFRIEYDANLLNERDVLVLARTVSGARRLVISDGASAHDPRILEQLATEASRHVQACVVDGGVRPEVEFLV